jgi:hypothetical protein
VAADPPDLTQCREHARAALALLSGGPDEDDPGSLDRAIDLSRSGLSMTATQAAPPGWLSNLANLGVALRAG